MANDEAKVKVGVEGAREAKKKAQELGKAFKGMGAEIGTVAAALVARFASMSTALAKVDPTAAADKFRQYRNSLVDLSVASGRSIASLKSGFASLQQKGLLPDTEFAKFSQTLAKTTYDFGDSTQAVQALREEGSAAGKSLAEMGPIATTLHNSFGETFNQMPETLGRIAASASALGNIGGPGELMDSFAALSDEISKVAAQSGKAKDELIGIMAAAGKGLSPQAAKRVQAQLIGVFTHGGEQLRENLHISRKDFYDSQGHIKVNAENVKRLRDYYLRREGGNLNAARRLASFSNNLGPELAFRLFSPDFMKDVATGANVSPSDEAAKRMRAMVNSQTGKEITQQNEVNRTNREIVGGEMNTLQVKTLNVVSQNANIRFAEIAAVSGAANAGTIIGGMAVAKKVFGAGKAVAAAGEAGTAAAAEAGAAGAVAKAAGSAVAKGALGTAATLLSVATMSTKSEEATEAQFKAAPHKHKALWGLIEYMTADDAKANAAAARASVQSLPGQPAIPGQPIPVMIVNQPPVQAHVKVTDASHHPNHVAAVQKSKGGGQ